MRPALSVLDLVPVPSGTSASQALRDSIRLAQLAERRGYQRYWISEHHGMPSIASSAPEVLLSRAAALTERIHVGSGGIMLPNHVPLRVAEIFQTLEGLYPGRVDLGLGRAPGSDARASRALRAQPGEHFGDMLDEMIALSEGSLPRNHPFHGVTVVPDDVALPPIWILGSSGASAHTAGSLGMGYSFASHFSPVPAQPALQRYRDAFRPSAQFEHPHAILAVSVICASTEEEAQYLASTVDLMWLRLRKGQFLPLPSPEEALAYSYSAVEQSAIEENRQRHIIGTPEQVRQALENVVEEAAPDEVMVVSNIHDADKRLKSYDLIADVMQDREN